MISTSWNLGIGTAYHAHKMRERKDARILTKVQSIRIRDTGADLQARLNKIKSDIEFDTIITGDKADAVKPHYTLGQRIHAWWFVHASR